MIAAVVAADDDDDDDVDAADEDGALRGGNSAVATFRECRCCSGRQGLRAARRSSMMVRPRRFFLIWITDSMGKQDGP